MSSEVFRHSWIEAALVISLFWTAIAHPDRIRSVNEFRVACMLLAVSIFAPVFLQIIFAAFREPGTRATASNTYLYMSAIPTALTALSVLIGLYSVTPQTKRKDA